MKSRAVALGLGIVLALAAGAACSSISDDSAPVTADAGGGDAPAADAPVLDDAPPIVDEDGLTPGPDADILATGYMELSAVAATETTVYFAERGTGTIHQVPLVGGPVAAFAAASVTLPSSLAATDTVVTWADGTNKTLSRRKLVAASAVKTIALAEGAPVAIVLGASMGDPRVVVATNDPMTGGLVQTFGPDLGVFLQTATTFTNLFDVATLGADAWWTEPGQGTIWKASTSDFSAPVMVQTGESGCESIAADASGIYWTRSAAGVVNMLRFSDNTFVSLGKTQNQPFGVAVDDSGVYWLTNDGELRRAKPAVEVLPPQKISSRFKAVFDPKHGRPIALTSQYVVWITSDGKVLRHAK